MAIHTQFMAGRTASHVTRGAMTRHQQATPLRTQRPCAKSMAGRTTAHSWHHGWHFAPSAPANSPWQ
eukprot:10853360-Alexandrium_andersonii.AAC.1